MAVSHVSASFNLSINDACTPNSPRLGTISKFPTSNFAPNVTSFVKGSPLVIRTSSIRLKAVPNARSAVIKCEQSANEGNSLDVWLGRVAMVGFAVAISVEISTGKGLLEVWSLELLTLNALVSQYISRSCVTYYFLHIMHCPLIINLTNVYVGIKSDIFIYSLASFACIMFCRKVGVIIPWNTKCVE